jgi:DNA-binding beta-propeller fold protein YncE
MKSGVRLFRAVTFSASLNVLAAAVLLFTECASGEMRTLSEMVQGNCVSCFKAKATNIPELPYSVGPELNLSAGFLLGEPAGVATNSKGHLFVFTRGSETRLLEFDERGGLVREIGKDLYGFALANSVRVDRQDNIWIVDKGTTMVIEFDPRGHVQQLYGRRPHPNRGNLLDPTPPGPPESRPYWLEQPVDVTWDPAGNTYIADGYINTRIVKYDKNGRIVEGIGARGTEPGQFNGLQSIASDAQGNIYVADRNNGRIQVFGSDLTFKKAYDTVGLPAAICISTGPHQYLFSSNSSPENSTREIATVTGEIYKMELDGTIIGKFGKAGKEAGAFSAVNQMDCRNENEITVAETTGWRVQKILLQLQRRPSK